MICLSANDNNDDNVAWGGLVVLANLLAIKWRTEFEPKFT